MEILVAMGISLGLMAAFLVVLQRCRSDYATHESLARVQDAARHAFHVIAADIEHAGFFGMRAADGAIQLASALPPGARDCGGTFALDLAQPVTGTDNGYHLPADATRCEPTATADGASATADTLTLRHSSLDRTSPRSGRMQVYSAMGSIPLMLFADGHAPGPLDSLHEVRDLEVRTYYIANSSVDRAGWPALRVKSLTESGGAAQFRDEEVMPGVEDLQVELRVARVEDGEIMFRTAWPGTSLSPEERVVAVRLWLRVRADVTEPGYRDAASMHYANTHFSPTERESSQRRLLIQRMVALRNAS